MKIGVLALQGAVQPHIEKLSSLGVSPVLVRKPEHLVGISGIILPGGESSAMIHLLKLNQLWEPLVQFSKEFPTWGICAGTILLARTVTSPAQESFDALNISVARNAYGRQKESFIAKVSATENWNSTEAIDGVFIRAPKILSVGDGVRVLFHYQDEPVMVEQAQVLASTFHPELTDSLKIHRYFLEKCSHG